MLLIQQNISPENRFYRLGSSHRPPASVKVKENFFCRGLFGGALVRRFLDVDDFRQALNIQKRLGLGDLQVFRALALYHYKNKNETEQLIIEEKGRVLILIEIEFSKI